MSFKINFLKKFGDYEASKTLEGSNIALFGFGISFFKEFKAIGGQ